jgi:CRISPR-associated protein Csd2
LRDLVEDKEGQVWKHLEKMLGLKQAKGLDGKDLGFWILESRGRDRKQIENELKHGAFINKYWDGRVFGNTFLEEAMDKETIKTGVVQFGLGLSLAPIEIERHTNTNKAGVEEGKKQGMAPMGYRFVPHGVYWMPFFVNPSMAHKSGCTVVDIELLKKLIPHAYAHTRSHARPLVELRHAWYCEHSNPLGSCSDFALIDALKPRLKKDRDPNKPSKSWDDYDVPTEKDLPSTLAGKIACVDLVNA